ncbi:hypothetical protein [Paracoccus lutimaris]|nr:hypothetical protein [Paracoccus lutimaris]
MELQRAVRLALIATPDVVQHVAPERIRTGLARPEIMPCIIMSSAEVHTAMLPTSFVACRANWTRRNRDSATAP